MHIWSIYGISGTTLSSKNELPHSIFTISLWSEFYSLNFTSLKDDCINYLYQDYSVKLNFSIWWDAVLLYPLKFSP